MEQYIKINAIDEDKNLLGAFKVSIDYGGFINLSKDSCDKEISIGNLILYNVPVVEYFDNRTPIQYYKNSNFNANVLLLEEHRYTVEFESKSSDLDVFYSLKNTRNSPIELFPNTDLGFLNFGSYVGKTFLDILNTKDNKILYKYPIEVRSRKINYSKDYATMIGDLSRFSSGLIYELSSPVYQSLKVGSSNKTPYEDFMLLEYLFEDENLPSTVEYLSRNLYTLLEETTDEVPTSLASNVGPDELIDVFSNSENLEKIENYDGSIWSKTKGYVPLKIKELKYVDSIDVPENRFYKNFLLFIDDLIDDLLEKVEEGYVADKLHEYKETLSYYLSARYFRDISPMDYPPLNSQVLQKKEGYRDILEYYLLFEFGFKLNWDEVVEDFRGYEKKVYRLYEYWCYFELLDVISQLTNQEITFEDLFALDDKNLNISLKEGVIKNFELNLSDLIDVESLSLDNNIDSVELDGFYDDLPISIDLMYNKTFKKDSDYYSYSVKLRPDYTLSINFAQRTFLIHFDAKYKLDIRSEDYKTQDIVKMHSYKDAIEDTMAAYVLYPGREKEIFYERKGALESVGAFPLNPRDDRKNKKDLLKFISDFILDLVNLNQNF